MSSEANWETRLQQAGCVCDRDPTDHVHCHHRGEQKDHGCCHCTCPVSHNQVFASGETSHSAGAAQSGL